VKDLRARQGIIAATIVGGLWRLIMLATKWNQKLLLNDSLYYSSQANQNAHGHWFRDVLGQHPGAEHAPLTSLVLTPSSLLPHHEFWQRATNTLLGIAFIPLVGFLVWRIAGRRAAVIAAVIAAAYPNLWMNDNLIMSESLSALSGSPVELQVSIDPDLISGVLVDIGDLRVDATARGRLDALREHLLTRAWDEGPLDHPDDPGTEAAADDRTATGTSAPPAPPAAPAPGTDDEGAR